MKLELLRLIYEYIKNRKEMDETFVNKIIEIVVNNKELNPYIKGIIITNEPLESVDEFTSASFNYYSRKLRMNLQGTIEFSQYLSKFYPFTKAEKILYQYFFITQIILHELEHVNQLQKEINKEDDIETSIISAANRYMNISSNLFINNLSDYIRKSQMLYKKYYRFAPTERLADYYSYCAIIEMLKELQGKDSSLIRYEWMKLKETCLSGYDDVSNPTKFYLEQTGSSEYWPEIKEKASTLTWMEKLIYGLEVPQEKLHQLKKVNEKMKERILI